MKRILKIILIPFILAGLIISQIGCSSESSQAEPMENQIATVQRGNLTIDITAVGNLALSRAEDLAFDLFYQEGTVEAVLVEEGDTVEEGQVIVKLDTEEWEDELSTLEDKVTTAERQIAAKQREIIQSEINLKNAEVTLEQTNTTYSLLDYKVAEYEVNEAERNLEDTLSKLSKYDPETPGYETYMEVVVQAQARLTTAQDKLDAMSSGFDTEEIAIKILKVELAQAQFEESEIAVEDAEKALGDAQKELSEAKSKSPIIIAPFDGFITMVNVEGGDEVLKGTVAVQLADPNKFEADIMVGELDIVQVEIEGEATVQVDALAGLTLPAKVTHISPTATIQSGVVNYKVNVEVESLEAIMQEQQVARQETIADIQQGELPERLKQAIEEGRMTQEQAEEMMKQREQGQGRQPGQVATTMPENFQLREGLTVTVSIIVDERTDVLLVPNSAITHQGMEAFVQVPAVDGTLEQRSIQTGISDWQFTEVTEGLSESEQIIVPQGTTTTSQQRSSGPMPFFRGGGNPH